MRTYKYQICLLGDVDTIADQVQEYVVKQVNDLGLDQDHIVFLDESSVASRERKAPCAAIFFGYSGANTNPHEELDPLVEDSLLIVPIVDDLEKYASLTPKNLKEYNGRQNPDGYQQACLRVLEHFRLLRSERRLFISYKRKDTSAIAHQLYDAFDQSGYDVFLDTRSVRGGEIFQDVLWHRMADSDVVVLLDSPNFRDSQWTEMEYARALSSDIHIQHLLWPGVQSQSDSALDEFLPLTEADFQSAKTEGPEALLDLETINDIVASTEHSRARALAARNMALIDGFCDLARETGHSADLQAGLSIKLTANGRRISVVPMVGVPTASRLHDIVNRAIIDDPGAEVWALYDHLGILERVVDHLDWLNDNLPLTALRKAHCRQAIERL